jgi:hypothetical protein
MVGFQEPRPLFVEVEVLPVGVGEKLDKPEG